jgi:hypothetical protein
LRYAQSDTEELAGLDELEAGLSTTAAGIDVSGANLGRLSKST